MALLVAGHQFTQTTSQSNLRQEALPVSLLRTLPLSCQSLTKLLLLWSDLVQVLYPSSALWRKEKLLKQRVNSQERLYFTLDAVRKTLTIFIEMKWPNSLIIRSSLLSTSRSVARKMNPSSTYRTSQATRERKSRI